MLLKSRSRTHHPHMHYSYSGGRRKNMSFHLDPLKKCFTPTLGVNTKNIPYRISPNKCSKVLVAISQKDFVAEKKYVAMQKLLKKEY